jgi:carboxypeptidase Q
MDDGGGVFVSWEAVRIIKQLGLKPRRTIRAIAYVNEENGDRGGTQYAIDHRNELNRTSVAIETDGGTFAPFRLGFDGSSRALPIMQAIGTLLARIGAGNVTVGGGGVDISPVCATGVPCGMHNGSLPSGPSWISCGLHLFCCFPLNEQVAYKYWIPVQLLAIQSITHV